MRIVVTGASRGIGDALAEGYRAGGHDVIGTTRADVDFSQEDSISRWSSGLSGPVDLLVCNAGIYQDRAESIDSGYSGDMWAEMMAVNVTGVFLTIQGLLPRLREAENAKIAIISSQMGSSTRASGTSIIYRVSKAAALNLGFNMASALKHEGIAVGIYHPGWVRTDMGGSAAEISVEESRDGLMARFDALSLATTGCFETLDGRNHPL
ncbi:MAG: SDR family NAD(P)-dependent oxidoreductase [Rhodobacteraceae bacterium]|nr:SDR family NAD(P)-dependent oxidoreductase [Paracoccaceae bacterium]